MGPLHLNFGAKITELSIFQTICLLSIGWRTSILGLFPNIGRTGEDKTGCQCCTKMLFKQRIFSVLIQGNISIHQ